MMSPAVSAAYQAGGFMPHKLRLLQSHAQQ